MHLEEVSRWPRVVTQDLGGAGSRCGLRGTACCAGFTAEVSSLQGVSFFFFFFLSNTIHRFMLGKAKSSALKNLKDRAFCIHSFLVHCEKERSGTRQNAMGLKGVSMVLAVLNGKTEVNDVSVINVTQSC